MGDKVSIGEQRAAVEAVLETGEIRIADLQAAAKMLGFVEKHEAVFRSVAEIIALWPDAKVVKEPK